METKEMLGRFRGAGRTTRLIELAVTMASCGEEMHILVARQEELSRFIHQIEQKILPQDEVLISRSRSLIEFRGGGSIKLVSAGNWKNLELEILTHIHIYQIKEGNLLVDHFVIEQRMTPFELYHLRRFEKWEALKTNPAAAGRASGG